MSPLRGFVVSFIYLLPRCRPYRDLKAPKDKHIYKATLHHEPFILNLDSNHYWSYRTFPKKLYFVTRKIP